MWQIRDSRCARTGLAGTLIAFSASVLTGCVPEAPGGADDPVGPGTPGPEARYSVQLRWLPPETDAEGEPLGDLEGFRLYFAPASEPLMETGGSIEVGFEAEGLVTGLSAGAWHFAVTAVDTAGNESMPSESVQVEVGAR
ncbi:MAG: fibronectin type III domain-containing protein [marine benthic group bacterium]|nr:fibronectin type III domain-containing protein [Gemmatimonadota bacterium]